MELSVVIPTYNEGANLPVLIRKIIELLDPELPASYELIVVDDQSPDGTADVVRELSSAFPQVKLIERKHERGLATAVVSGWRAARGKILGVIDADLQHPPEVILHLLEAIRDGADLAVASRHIPGGGVSDWNVFRRMISRGGQLIGMLLAPGIVGRVSDPMSGYFLMRREAIEGCELRPVGYKVLLEVLARANLTRIDEVPYVFCERKKGGSKLTLGQYLNYLRHLWRLRHTRQD
jgi:dolichol-phosphate mannosyltransferase